MRAFQCLIVFCTLFNLGFAQDTHYLSYGYVITYDEMDGGFNDMIQTSNDDLWFATYDGVFRLSSDQWTHYTVSDGLGGEKVNSLFEDSHGTIWAGYSEPAGFSYFKNGVWTNIESTGSVPERIHDVQRGADGKLYVCGETIQPLYGDIFIYNYGEFTQLWLEWEGYDNLIVGYDGNLYVGAYAALLKYDYSNWSVVGYPGPYSIWDLVSLNDGSLMLATAGGGVKVYDTSFTASNDYSYQGTQGGLLADGCNVLAELNAVTTLVGTQYGLCSFDGANWANYAEVNDVIASYSNSNESGVSNLFVANNSEVWIAPQYGEGVVHRYFYSEWPTTITEMSSSNELFKSYPQPVESTLNVETINPGQAKISILDMSGRVLDKQNLTTQTNTLDFSTYSAGVYIVSLEQSGQVGVTRVIKN